MTIKRELVEAQFKSAAFVLGWDTQSPWEIPTVHGKCHQGACQGHHGMNGKAARLGAVMLTKFGRANRYEIVQVVSCGGGEHVIKYACSGDAMYEWLTGVRFGAYTIKGQTTPALKSALATS